MSPSPHPNPTLGLSAPVYVDEDGVRMVVKVRDFEHYAQRIEVPSVQRLLSRLEDLDAPGRQGSRHATRALLALRGPLDEGLLQTYVRLDLARFVALNERLPQDPDRPRALFDAIEAHWHQPLKTFERRTLLSALGLLLDAEFENIAEPGRLRALVLDAYRGERPKSGLAQDLALRLPELPSETLRDMATRVRDFRQADRIAQHPSADRSTWDALLDAGSKYLLALCREPRALGEPDIYSMVLESLDERILQTATRHAPRALKGGFFRRTAEMCPEWTLRILEDDKADLSGIDPHDLEPLLTHPDRRARERAQVGLGRLRKDRGPSRSR